MKQNLVPILQHHLPVLIRMASFFFRAKGNTIIDAERRRKRNIASY
ncbi:hypothetical protein [Flavitalea sp.]|nr:hypothetical protein [Flavitalea sp.]